MTQADSMRIIPDQDLVNMVITQTSAGVCLRGYHRGTGRCVSVKLLPVTAGLERWWMKHLQDLYQVKRRQSDRVHFPTGLYGTWPPLGLVSDWMQGGSLHSLLYETKQYPDLPLPLRVRILLDVAEGLSHLHSLWLPHLALKPTNVLLDQHLRAKVCDWGQRRDHCVGYTVCGRSPPCATDQVYLPPEVLRGEPPSMKTDVYSFGIMLYETLNRRLPPEAVCSPQAFQSCASRWTGTGVAPLDQALSHLMTSCCCSDPQNRPSSLECMQELKKVLAAFDCGAPDRAVLHLMECKRALMGCEDHKNLEVKVDINNLELYGGCRHPKSTCAKRALLNFVQAAAPTPRTPAHSDAACQSSPPSLSGTSLLCERASGSGAPSSPMRLRSYSAPGFQEQSGAERADQQQRGASSLPSLPPSLPSNPTTRPRHSCQAGGPSQTCCQILRERRELIVRCMTEGRLNNLLDILRARQALGREQYELITAALTLAARTRCLLDTCLCLGEGVATVVASSLGLVSMATANIPSQHSH